MKKISLLFLILAALVVLSGQVFALPEQYLNLIGVDYDLSPQNESELNYVELRPLAKHYGMSLNLDSKDKEVLIKWNKTSVLFKFESRIAEVNGKREIMDNPVLNINGHIMVPVTFMEKLLKIDFKWRKVGSIIIKEPDFTENIKVYLYTNNDSYEFGDQIVVTLIIKNTGQSKLRVPLSSSQIYDLTLSYKNKELWRWSKDKMFTSAITNFELNPGESKVYTITLPKELLLTPAQYQLQATFTSKPNIKSDIYTFTIR